MGTVAQDIAAGREVEAWQLRTRKGWSIYRIAEKIGVTPQAVSLMLKRVGVKIHKQLAATLEAQKAEQAGLIDSLIENAFDGWERSQEDAVTEKTREKAVAIKPDTGKVKRRDGGRDEDEDDYDAEGDEPGLYLDKNGDEVPAEERARKIAAAALDKANGNAEEAARIIETITAQDRKGQVGDPRFIQAALAALAAKRAIWGLDAPKAESMIAPVVVKVYGGGHDLREMVKGEATTDAEP